MDKKIKLMFDHCSHHIVIDSSIAVTNQWFTKKKYIQPKSSKMI